MLGFLHIIISWLKRRCVVRASDEEDNNIEHDLHELKTLLEDCSTMILVRYRALKIFKIMAIKSNGHCLGFLICD
jgi:hypothetical protein